MKAWNVTHIYEVCGTIVFAETAGQAKAIALGTHSLMGSDYRDLRARRMQKLDDLSSEPGECDWDDAKLVTALVRGYSWGCEEPDVATCETCPAVEWCDWRAEKLLDEDEGGGEG